MPEPSALSASQIAGREVRRADHDRTLTAMHELEGALDAAAPGRESSWRAAVLAALIVLDEATDVEYVNAAKPDSLLSDIKRTQPRLRTRVRGLRTQYAHLRQAITSMRAELDKPDDDGTDHRRRGGASVGRSTTRLRPTRGRRDSRCAWLAPG